jgi:hypothetical protein
MRADRPSQRFDKDWKLGGRLFVSLFFFSISSLRLTCQASSEGTLSVKAFLCKSTTCRELRKTSSSGKIVNQIVVNQVELWDILVCAKFVTLCWTPRGEVRNVPNQFFSLFSLRRSALQQRVAIACQDSILACSGLDVGSPCAFSGVSPSLLQGAMREPCVEEMGSQFGKL